MTLPLDPGPGFLEALKYPLNCIQGWGSGWVPWSWVWSNPGLGVRAACLGPENSDFRM